MLAQGKIHTSARCQQKMYGRPKQEVMSENVWPPESRGDVKKCMITPNRRQCHKNTPRKHASKIKNVMDNSYVLL